MNLGLNKFTTGLIILLTAIIWIVYDILALIYGGVETTFSRVITEFSYYSPALPFLTGGLCGHWFFPAKRNK